MPDPTPRSAAIWYLAAGVGLAGLATGGLVAGLVVDAWMEGGPWGAVIGTVLGFTVGTIEAVVLIRRAGRS